MVATVIAGITAIALILSVLFKPYIFIGRVKIGVYVAICVSGAAAELIFGGVTLKDAAAEMLADSAVNPVKILALFLSMTLISVYLGDAGFFHLVAEKVFSRAKAGKFVLFIILYAIVSFLTVFTSNDIVVLTFTPPICIFCKKNGISPLPFLIGEFVAANTWSMALIVGNPTNVYLATGAGITFSEYFKIMILPAAAAGTAAFIMLCLLFKKDLFPKKSETLTAAASPSFFKISGIKLCAALTALIGVIIALALSDIIGAEMWLVTVSAAGGLFLFNLFYGLWTGNGAIAFDGLKKAPWELVPFVLSMSVIVLAAASGGWTEKISASLISGKSDDAPVWGVIETLTSNLMNNIPSSVLAEKIISGNSLPATYGAIIGTNIGAFVTPVGALAGIMWNKILCGYGVKLSFAKFTLYGVIIAAAALSASVLTLYALV